MDMNTTINKVGEKVAPRALAVRTRTWTFTITILIALAFYIAVNVTTRQAINWVDFVLLCVMQVTIHGMYFPDGDLYGQKDKSYIANKQAYGDRADGIIQGGKAELLREYCDYEFEQRKDRYIKNQCAMIGITPAELEELKKDNTAEQIKAMKKYEFVREQKTYCVHFSKKKRKILYHLIFSPLPVQKNNSETITSAVENDGSKSIRDGSAVYKKWDWIKFVVKMFVLGLTLSYIGYTLRDGFGFAQVVQIFMYITTMLGTAVTAFTSGETCSRVYKSRFYLELSNFIDGFNEWCKRQDG